jgi:hypothetical protein
MTLMEPRLLEADEIDSVMIDAATQECEMIAWAGNMPII